MLQDKLVMVGIILIGGDNYLLTGFEAAQNFIIPWILTADGYIAFDGKLLGFIQNQRPIARL